MLYRSKNAAKIKINFFKGRNHNFSNVKLLVVSICFEGDRKLFLQFYGFVFVELTQLSESSFLFFVAYSFLFKNFSFFFIQNVFFNLLILIKIIYCLSVDWYL